MTMQENRPVALGNLKRHKRPYDNSALTQRSRILASFSVCPRLSTLELREMGILHPCGRVMELRRLGHKIDTQWIKAPDSNGVHHRVGLYVYQGVSKGVSHE